MPINKLDVKSWAHILGLTGQARLTHGAAFEVEGMTSTEGLALSSHRYNLYTQRNQEKWQFEVSFDRSDLSKSEFINNFHHLSHGQCLTIGTKWEQHGISISLVVEKNLLHLIVVNSGNRSFPRNTPALQEDKFLTTSVQAYSINLAKTSKKSINELLEILYSTCKGKKKEGLALLTSERVKKSFQAFFINIKHLRNIRLSKQLQRSFQKSGNCNVSNLNYSWRIKLAADAIKAAAHEDFNSAFQNARETYKNIRAEDRSDALLELIKHKAYFSSGWNELVIQALAKLNEKSSAKKDSHFNNQYFLRKLLDCKDTPSPIKVLNDLLTDQNMIRYRTLLEQKANKKSQKTKELEEIRDPNFYQQRHLAVNQYQVEQIDHINNLLTSSLVETIRLLAKEQTFIEKIVHVGEFKEPPTRDYIAAISKHLLDSNHNTPLHELSEQEILNAINHVNQYKYSTVKKKP